MHRLPLLLAAVVTAVWAALAQGGGQAPGFRLADASAACRPERGGLVCRSLAVRAGLSLPARGVPRAVDARIWWDAATPVLRRWSHGGISCRAAGGAILCRNGSDATIALGPRQVAVAV